MPKRKRKQQPKEKPASELTMDEAMDRTLGKEVTEAAKRVAHQKDTTDVPSNSHKRSVS